MAHAVELSDEAFQKLKRAAEREGVTPAEWLEATISRESASNPPARPKNVAAAFAPYVISVDSSKQTPHPKYRSPFGDIVDEKLAKQGFKRPEWPR